MVIFDLEDFEYWVDNSVVSKDGVAAFSPLFIYLIYWAYSENMLSNDLSNEESFINALSNLKSDDSSFANFVNNELDGKLCDSYFNNSIKQFVSDYFEYDGYSKDLVNCFKLNLWEMPNSLEKAKEMNGFINKSLANYKKNLVLNPSIIDFSSK